MKFFILSLILCFVYTTSYAQIPQQINYQGVLTDGSGAIVPDGNYDLTFTIYDAPVAGTNLWADTFNNVPTENGVFNVTLGSGAALNINFDVPYWIGITVGVGAELTPRIALTSSPYSIRTKSIEITDAAGQSAISAINAATSGTINAARLQSTVTTQGNTFNGNNQLLQLDASGNVPAVNLPDPLPVLSGNNLTNLDASDLASGTIPDARIPNPLPAVSGANLTNLDASDLASGTVPTVRLGSGTADNTTFLRGDNTWATPSGGGGGGATAVVGTSNAHMDLTASYVNLPGVSLTLEANSVYKLTGFFQDIEDGGTSGRFDTRVNYTGTFSDVNFIFAGSTIVWDESNIEKLRSTADDSGTFPTNIEGYLITSTGGTLTIQIRLSGDSGNNVDIQSGAKIILIKL